MLPAGVIDRVDCDTETVFVNRTKEQIQEGARIRRQLLQGATLSVRARRAYLEWSRSS